MQISNHTISKYDVCMGITHQENNKTDEAKHRPTQHPSEDLSPPVVVELSTRGRDMQHIKDMLQNVSDVREVRIKELTHAAAQGKLNLKGLDIATKLLLDVGHGVNTRNRPNNVFETC